MLEILVKNLCLQEQYLQFGVSMYNPMGINTSVNNDKYSVLSFLLVTNF